MFISSRFGCSRVRHHWSQAVEVVGTLLLQAVGFRHSDLARLHACPPQWGRVGAPTGVAAPEQTYQHLYALARAEMFGKEVCWVPLAEDLPEVHPAAADSMLDPQQVRVYVAELAKTLPSADTDRRR